MSDEELHSFVGRASEQVAETPEMAARNTQLRIVEPLLSTLGWNVRSTEVTAAWPPESDEPFDYGLFVDDQPVIAVETFGTGTALTPERLQHCLDRIDRIGLDWGLVTNGRQFVFLARDEDGWVRRSCRLADLLEHSTVLNAYSKEQTQQRQAGKREAAERLRDKRSEMIEEITGCLRERVGTEFDSEFRTVATRAVDDAITTLEEGATPRTHDTERDTPDSNSQVPPEQATDASTDTEQSTRTENGNGGDPPRSGSSPASGANTATSGSSSSEQSARTDETRTGEGSSGAPPPDPAGTASPDPTEGSGGTTEQSGQSVPEPQPDTEYVVRFFGGSTTVGAVGNPTPSGAFVGVVSYLGEQRALTNKIDTPWGVDEDRALIARSPTHPDGSPMEQFREIGAYYLWTAAPKEVYRRAIEDLAEVAGLRAMFQGDW